MTVSIDVDKQDALADEVIAICTLGLAKRQSVTVRAEVTEKGQRFAASGCYVSNDHGIVDLTTNPSLSGTYKGVSAMGLFWSMKSSPGQSLGLHLVKSNSSFPLMSVINVYEGHIDFDQTYTTKNALLCTYNVRRWYMAKDVQKKPVKCGRVTGMLFLPPGKGPFPGVIDMFGQTGSLVEFRAALLASRGFASLALPYMLYGDLPKDLVDIEFEYVMEAIDWFSQHPCVISNNIGVVGLFKGGEIALHMSYYSPKVKAVASINGAPFFTSVPMLYQGKHIGQSTVDIDQLVTTDEGVEVLHVLNCEKENFLRIWEKDVKYLLICGGNDRCLNPAHLQTLYTCFPEDKIDNCQLVVYPGAGHLIEHRYAPLASSTMKNNRGVNGDHGLQSTVWGGNTEGHGRAQKDSWKRLLEFFRTNLPRAHEHNNEYASKL